MLYKSREDKYHQYFLDEVYKILFSMGVTTGGKDELASDQLKDVAQTW